MIKEFYSPKEIAEVLSLNKATILKLISQGKIKASKVGTGKRIVYRTSKQDLAVFIEERTTNEQPKQIGSTEN